MSLDKPKERGEITGEIKQREHDKQKRLADTLKVVTDKKKEADVAKGLRLSGTREGVDAIKGAIKEAAEATDQEFDGQKTDLNKEVFEPAQKLEEELKGRSEQLGQDEKELDRTATSLDTKSAGSKMAEAGKETREDREFVDSQREDQERDREGGEKEIEKQKAELKGTTMSFRV